MSALIKVKNLHKNFRVKSKETLKAVNNVSFEIDKGKTLGLIGESGSGKTTIGRCIIGLIEPTSGEIFFNDENITNYKLSQHKKTLQMVFQDPYDSLNPRLTAFNSIMDSIRNESLSKKSKIELLEDIAYRVELTSDELELFPHQLSGGQQQRVGIARAMINKPTLIVLDEPTTALDITIRSRITDLLIDLQNQLGITYLYISHDLSTVEYICDKVAIMYLGKIVESGNKNDVFNNPKHPYSKALLSSVLYPDPDFQRKKYELEGEIPSPIDLPSGCPLHPRCPEAIEKCSSWEPELITVAPNHASSCLINA